MISLPELSVEGFVGVGEHEHVLKATEILLAVRADIVLALIDTGADVTFLDTSVLQIL
jgi:hypothetical protein